MSAPKEKKKDQHRESHFVLTMTTKQELESAASKGLKVLEGERLDKFKYAEDGAPPLTFDLRLNLQLPLTTMSYYEQKLCRTSKVCMINCNIEGQKNFVHEDVVCFDVHSYPTDARDMHQFGPYFSISDDCEVPTDDCHKGRFHKLYLPKDEGESISARYIIAENHKYNKALFKVELKSNKDVDCTCNPCKSRDKIPYVAYANYYNIVELERH